MDSIAYCIRHMLCVVVIFTNTLATVFSTVSLIVGIDATNRHEGEAHPATRERACLRRIILVITRREETGADQLPREEVMKTLFSVIRNVVPRALLVTLVYSSSALLPLHSAEATTITLGKIDVTGSFTLNPAYVFGTPSTQIFGTFSGLTVTHASGIFTPFVATGDVLSMNTPDVLTPPFNVLLQSKPLTSQMLWSVGGFTIDTSWTVVTGADVGRNVFGLFDLSFLGLDLQPILNPLGAIGFWQFTAPPYDIANFHSPITGPINLTIVEVYNTVPEGPSLLMLASAVGGLVALCWIGWGYQTV